jgi:phenylacetate-CoA ligase
MLPWITRNLVYAPMQAIRGERVSEYMDRISSFDRLPLESKRAVQWEKLIALLEYVQNNNHYYSRLLTDHGIVASRLSDAAEFRKIPLLTKDLIRSHYTEMRSAFTGRVSHRKTSGSTGVPLAFEKDRDASAYMDALMFDAYGWHGIGIGDKQARVWGVPLDIRGRTLTALKDILLNRKRLNAFGISEQSCRDYFNGLTRFSPKYMYGLPSTISAFASTLSQIDIDPSEIGLEIVVTTGEILFERDRSRIESLFKARVVNEYGCTESGIIAFEASDHKLRQMTHNLYIELLDRDTGEPVEPGEMGEIVITELHSYAFPLIRYKIGDLAVQGALEAADPAAFPCISEVVGRVSDLIVTPEGNRVAAAILDYTLIDGVRRFKAFQRSVDLLEVQIVADGDFSKSEIDSIESRWREYLGDRIRIDFRVVDEIEPSNSGKMTVLESEINKDAIVGGQHRDRGGLC